VQPPFVAAPIEGRRIRIWLGLGLVGGVLAVCCGVGVVALGGLLVLGQEAVNEQAQRAVSDYLAAVTERDWQAAYELRCEEDRAAESLPEFTDRAAAQPPIDNYQVQDFQLGSDSEISVPVEVTYAGGDRATLVFPVDQTPTGRFEVCGQVRPG
jgi:hypothetical protein